MRGAAAAAFALLVAIVCSWPWPTFVILSAVLTIYVWDGRPGV